ncbi:MAG: hypothetical protein HY735_16955 [Verrucomicrobia bacterium]|nr:hypothetical protein [Verrucomicrobiota bacterium]
MHSRTFQSLLSPVFALGVCAWSSQGAIYNEVNGRVVVEAEHFDRRVDGPVKKYLIVPDEDPGSQTFSNMRGDKFIQVLPDAGENRNADASVVGTGATVDYKVQINTTGEYQLFMRGVGWDGSADSYYVQIVEISSPAWYRYSPDPATSDFSLLRNNNADGNSVIGWNGYARPESNSGDGSEEPALYNISKAGIYTIRISQREDGTAIDAFILQRTSLPLPTDPGPPESPTVVVEAKPLAITALVPSADVKNARFDASVQVVFADGTTKLAANSIVLQLDGATVTPVVTSDAGTTTAKYQPASIFKPNTTHSATVSYSDSAGAKFTQTWSFTAANYTLLPATAAVTADRSRAGFLVRTWKSPGQTNTLAWTEEQLAGLRGGNEADVSSFTDKQYGNSYFDETGPINYWNTGGQGNFTNSDTQNTPGLANDGTNDDSYSIEAIAYLDLPAGALTMGVNSDDGFRVTMFSGDPRDQFNLILGQFDGGRGVANSDFPFVVEKAGTYPFRLIYEEGSGDAAVEWYMLRTDNTRHLINNPDDTVSIRAYRPVSGPTPAYVASITPAVNGQNVAEDASISATIIDGRTKVVANTVKLSLDGVALSATATKTADKTTIGFKPATAFAVGSKHTATLTYVDDSSPPVSRTVSWDFNVRYSEKLFVAGTLFIEAEDVDYGHGKYVKDPKAIGMNGSYAGGAYAGLGTAEDQDFDWHLTSGPDGQAYRPDTMISAGKQDGTAGNERGLFQVTTWWTLGWNDGGEWYNYTRDFPAPAKDYAVYGHLSSGGAAINIQVDQIVSGQGQADAQQAKKVLGYFTPKRATAGWDVLEIFPMTDIDGKPVTVNLGGNVTLRTTILPGSNSDQDYFAFVPVTAPPPTQAPKVGSIKSDGKNITIEWSGAATLQAADDVAGPWADVAGAASGKAIAISGNRKFYRLKQ